MKITRCLLMATVLLLAAGGPLQAAEFKAGVAKTVITPLDPDTPRVLVYGGTSRGLNRDIHARALSLNDGNGRLVIVTYDLNCLDVATPILRSRCKHELGLDPARLILMATHNHAAPIQIVPDNFEYGRWLAERIFALIQEAIADESGPAKLMYGTGRAYFNANMYSFKVEREVQVLEVTRGGKTAAVLFNHATHPLQESTLKTGTGHPGYALDEIERRIPGAVAMYADACGGDQFVARGLAVRGSHLMVKCVGKELAMAVLRVLDKPMTDVTGPLSAELEVISLPLAPPLSYEEAQKLGRKIPLDIGLVPYPHPDRESNWIRALLMHYEQGIPFPTRTTDRVCTDDAFLVQELPEPREFPCIYEETIVARIGPMVLVSMQGEVCSPIGTRIKQKFEGQAPLMVFAYMGEHNLYIPTRKLVRMDTYQAQVIRIQYASPVGWSEDVEDEMVEGVVKMIESALAGKGGD